MRRREDKAARTLLLRLFGRWHALSLRSTHARETGGMAAKMEQLQAELSGAESARQIQLLAMRQRMLVLAKARLLRLLTMLPPVVDVWSRHPESAPGDGDIPGDVGGGAGVIPGVEKPRLVWGAFYRQSYSAETDSPEDVALPSNVATCPAPDASCDFIDAVRAAERAAARLFGRGDGEKLFPDDTPSAAGAEDGDGDDRTNKNPDDEEDEMDALLRDIPGLDIPAD